MEVVVHYSLHISFFLMCGQTFLLAFVGTKVNCQLTSSFQFPVVLGELTPAQTLDLMSTKNHIMIDIRSEKDKEKAGIPRLPPGARSKLIAIPKSFAVAVTSMIDHGRAMIDHGPPENSRTVHDRSWGTHDRSWFTSPRDLKEGRLLPPMGEQALNRARENEVGDSAGGCVCPQRRAHSVYLAFPQDYVFWAIVFPRLAEQVPCATTYPNGESPGGSWATNGHHPSRVSPDVVSLGCRGSLYGRSSR
ncbi:hypothetical protein LguiA_029907 [Lonicera macranthoides]